MLLTLWCKEGVGQTFDAYPGATKVIHKYQKYDNLVCDLTGEMDDILAELGYTQPSDMDNNGGYIRWSVINADGVNANNLETNIYNSYFPNKILLLYGRSNQNWWASHISSMNSNAYYWYTGRETGESGISASTVFVNYGSYFFNVSLSLYGGETMQSTFPGYSVSCYIANEPFNTSTNAEPQIDIQYVFHFNETGASPVDPFENTSSISETKKQSENIYEALSPTSASITLNDATAPYYIRWYFADASGKAVANPGFNLTNGSYTYTSQGNSIYYGGTTTDTNAELLKMTVTPQNGKSWSDLTSYKLVALLSNEVGTTGTDGTLTQEPLIATKYEISFDYVTFASALPSNQHTLDIEVTEANAQTATISLSEQWKQIKSDLGAETVSYMKYYWLDEKTGSLTGSVSFSEHPLAGMHWLKPVDTSFSTDMLNFTASVTSGVITDYKLVILLSDEAAAYDENSTWVKEPTLQSMYTVGFYAPRTEFDGSLVSGGISEKVEVTYEYGATKVQVGDANDATDTYSLVYDWGQNTNSIQSLFNYITQSGSGWSTNVYYPNYRRAYVRYKSSQELLANQSDWLTWTPYYLNDDTQFNYNALFYNEKGEFWTKSYAQYRQGDDGNNWEWAWFNGAPSKSLLAVTVNLPEGTDLTFEDIEVVVILAKKDAEREIHSSDVHTVELGPDGYEVEYIYSFKEGNAPFENVPEGITDYPGSKSINWLTTQPMAISLADYCTADGGQPAITYVRYLLTDKSGNEVPWNNAGVTLTAPDGHTFTAQGNSQYIYQATATSDLLTVYLQATTLANLQNYNLKAYVSAQTADIATTQREPQIEAVYTVSFDAVTFENTVSATEYKTIDIYEEQSYTTISVDLGGTAPTYVRWYWSWDGSNNVPQTDWTFYNTTVTFSDYNGTMYHYAGTTPNEELNKLTITPPVGTDAKDLPLTNLKLVALVSTKTVDDGAQTTAVDEQTVLVKEPIIDKKYIISFASVPFEKSNSIYNATKKEDVIYVTDEQKNGNVSVTVELDENLPTILSMFYKNNATDLDAGFYLRWYIVDGSGNRVTDLTGWSLSSANNGINYTVNNYGHYWYSALNTSIKVSENQNLMNLVVKSPSGTDLTSYKAVCVMSANLNDATVIEGNLVSEPTWTLQYTYSFASLTFEGSTTGAQSLSETIRLADDAMSSVTLSLPLSSVQDHMDNEASSFYIRYYLTDKTGNRVDLPTGVTITPKDITLTSSDYGHYWYSSTGIGSITDLGVTVADGNGAVDLRNYNVVAVMSSNAPLQVETDGTVTYEPREMEVVYTYELKKPVDNSFDGACIGVTKKLIKTITEGQTKITLTDLRDDWANNTDNIKSLFNNGNPLYRHVYVRNKKTGDILLNQSEWIIDWSGDYSEIQSSMVFVSDEFGSFWTRNYLDANNLGWASFDSYVCKVSITVPTGFSLIDHEVVMILSSKSEREYDYTSNPKTLTKGPEEHEVEYIFRFTDGVDRFSGSAATDAIEKSFRRELEEDENGVYDKTAQLNLSDDMSDEYRAKLTEGGTVYLRWYVTDKNGNMLSPDASPVSLTLHESDKFHQTEYGYIWYSGYDGEGTFSTDLLSVTATASASVNLYDYNVVCVMTTDVSDATMEDEEFTKESSWEARYTYVFTRAFAGKLADGAKTIYKTLVVSDGETSVNVPLSRRIGEIRSFFGMKSYDELNQNFHIRWVLLDNDDNEVYIQNKLTNSNYYENDYGIYWNTKANKNSASLADYNLSALLDVTYTLSANTNWDDYKLVIYMTDDNEETDGVRTETYTENNNNKVRLVHEPNHLELRYIIDFKTVSEVQSRFVHYKGYTNSDFTSVEGSTTTNNVVFNAQTGEYESVNKDIRQQTHEWTYEIYVEPGAKEFLKLPFVDGDGLEPQGYFRWYNWLTDMNSPYVEGRSSTLKSCYGTDEINRGLFATCLSSGASNTLVGVTFTAPSGNDWNEIIIACDVSKYVDGMDLSKTYWVHEPTISYRYKYIIRPARMIADAIKEGVNDPNDNLLENHGDVTIGISDAKSATSLRLNLSNVGYYYYYPYDKSKEEVGKSPWGDSYVQATKIFWRVYDSSGRYYKDFDSYKELFFVLSQDNINTVYNDKSAPDVQSKQKEIEFNIGEKFYVIAYASNGDKTKTCPVARFNCQFSGNYPILAEALTTSLSYDMRTNKYLDEHYSRVGVISFDIEQGSTLLSPTNQIDNANPMPFKWNRSHYGYCYPELYNEQYGNAIGVWAGLGPLHGDYRLVKVANVTSALDITSSYNEKWHQLSPLYDLTYEYSNHKENGYFLYVDASEESRPIANVAFEGEMCVGSTLVLSAMVADMTDKSIQPQLIFKLYGIKTDVNGNETERSLIHSFATCHFPTVRASSRNVWYQVYAKVTLQQNSKVEQYQQFVVSIDNYCDGTLGADYAIDDIRIYTQNSKVEVKQDAVLCGNDKLSVKLMMKHETLLAMMPSVNPSDYPMPVYYRFCEEDGTPVKGDDFYGAGLNEYGQVDFRYYFYDPSSSISEETAVGTEEKTEELAHHYQKTADGARYFMLSKVVDFSSDPIEYQTYALEPGKKYYVSVAVPEVKTDENGKKYYVLDEHSWGAPTDVCSMYSNPFEPMMQSMKLLFGGTSIDRISVTCGTHETGVDFELTGALQIPDEETGQMVSIENPASCRFDWIVEEKTNEYVSVMTPAFKVAWNAFRYRKGETLDDTPISGEIPESEVNETFTEEHRTLLNQVISAKKLHLLANAKLKGYSYEVGKTYIITALPLDNIVKQTVNGVEKPYTVCPEPMEVTVEARLDGPELDFGFEAVNYESIGMLYGAEGLRVGLDYLENMQEKQIPLHIPINSYKIGGLVQTDYDVFLDELGMIVIDSNDPTWSGYLDGAHRIAYEKDEKHQIDETTKSMEVYFHPKFHIMDLTPGKIPSVSREGDDIKFHEGYWYMVKVKYVKEESELVNSYGNRCYGESYLTIKVVPKYMTWGEGLPNNSNWLNDANWRRSSKEELYKVKVNTDGYPVYGDTNESDEVLHQLSNKQGFVPMKFTKVTILSDMPSPYPFLNNLVPNVHTGIIDKQYMYNGDNSAPTENIEYDMMVKITPEICPYKVGTTDLVYECEHFYGNICEQIYFKPRAQLRYQHYLDYEKAWVEMELSANKWMMLTSPFEQLYAGDFYVPAVEEGGTYPYGRQETEAFQDINFGDKSGESALYSRNGFPIYQRSWDKTNSMVVTAEDDALRDDYDAFIDYEWTEQITSEAEDAEGNITTTTQTVMKDVDVVATQWSHVYNDMEKLYEPGRGFSVRLHHTDRQEVDGTDTDGNTIYKDKKALLRFPKADTQYHYYDHADKEGHDVTVDKSKHHRLAADGVATGMVQITPIKNANGDNPYYMVGNPYMASVRMELFFNANPHLVKTYWVVSNGAALSATEATGLGIIGPMQSFFVKTEDGQPVTNVLFSPAMTVSHLVSGAAEASETDDAETISFTTRATANVPMAQTRVVLSAEADNGFVDEEDVETLLDSNLEDVPMVYTVAGTQAAMVNRLNDVTLLPLGLFGAEGETVDVQVHGVDRFSQTLYFYDASTGKQTALEEGTALSLEANVHGRYFLTTRALEDDAVTDDTDWQVRAYSLQRGELIVAAMPQDYLRQVRIYGVNGHQVVNDAAVQSHVATYALPSGIYVAEVVTERLSRPQVVKVVVR